MPADGNDVGKLHGIELLQPRSAVGPEDFRQVDAFGPGRPREAPPQGLQAPDPVAHDRLGVAAVSQRGHAAHGCQQVTEIPCPQRVRRGSEPHEAIPRLPVEADSRPYLVTRSLSVSMNAGGMTG